MPGFGRMLGVSKRWEDIINNRIIRFLESNAQSIVVAVHVLDISTFLEVTRRLEKKGFISVDVENVLFLTKILGETPFIAANKIDKADEIELDANISEFINQIKEGHPYDVSDNIFPVSAKTGERLGSLKNAIHKKLVVKGFRTPFKIR
jgi:GTP-binding protein EngB required for normal cell division